MKIKITDKSYKQILQDHKKNAKHNEKPIRPNLFFRTLMRLVSIPDLLATKFSLKKEGMEKLGKKEPAFILMNHSSFIDLEIVAKSLYPRPFNIVATTDAFVGKEWLMKKIGCIPTKKFVSDPSLVRNILHAVRKLKSSVVMFPEVGYSFDGTATTLPDNIGGCVKMLGAPLVMLRTYGAFSRDPLYNNLQRRKVKVSAKMKYLLSPEQIKEMSDGEITKIIKQEFSFDNFRWQKENRIKISEPFRADGLERVLYKCPNCKSEGRTRGKGELLSCLECKKTYRLSEYGEMECVSGGECEFPHIPDWYSWERECVREEITSGAYSFDAPVDILAAADLNNVYRVGTGRLTHTSDGFRLVSDDGEIDYTQKPLSSYSMNADFNWYELGDIVSVGDTHCLFYCFPKIKDYPVAKMRLATEEIYKIKKAEYDKAHEQRANDDF